MYCLRCLIILSLINFYIYRYKPISDEKTSALLNNINIVHVYYVISHSKTVLLENSEFKITTINWMELLFAKRNFTFRSIDQYDFQAKFCLNFCSKCLDSTCSTLVYTPQIRTVDLNNADDCARKFKSNTWLGAVMFLGIVAGTYMKEKEPEKSED